MKVYRIHPQGAPLHAVKSITSNDEVLNGVFVFESLPEAWGCREWDQRTRKVELAEIICKPSDLRQVGDYEGVLLLARRGRIVKRWPFATQRRCTEWIAAQVGA